MLRSLFTGISGLSANQEMLDVTSNNIANVNTTGFKSSSVQFEDTLSQTMSSGGAGTAPATPPSVGGTNPTQVGLGVQIGSTDMNFSQGSSQATGVPTNMLVNGDGFFVVSSDGNASNLTYSRAGDFTMDNVGHLVLPDGSMLMQAGTANGIMPPTALNPLLPSDGTKDLPLVIPTDATSYSIDATGTVTWTLPAASASPVGPAQISMATFANPDGLLKNGASEYAATPAAGAALYGTAKSGAIGSITTGYTEMSNVDLATELTNLIVAERGFQASSKVISTSDQVLQTLVTMT